MDDKEKNGCVDSTIEDNNDNKKEGFEHMKVDDIPKDNKNFVFLVSVFLGISVVFPYNMLISVNDYWNFKFRNTSFPFNKSNDELTDLQKSFPSYLAIAANVPLAVFVVLTSFFGGIFGLRSRVAFTATFKTLIFGAIVILATVNTDSWQKILFDIILVLSTIFAILGAVYRCTFLGNLGRFPARYIGFTQVGIALGSVLPPLINIIVLGTNISLHSSTILCLSLGMFVIMMTVPLYHFANRTPFFQHHSGAAVKAPNPTWRDFLVVFKTSPLLLCCVFVSYATSISTFPALAALIKPVSQVENQWNLIFFVPVCCFLVYTGCDWLGRSFATMSQWPGPGPASEALIAVGVVVRLGLIPLIMMCNLAPLNRTTRVVFPSDIAYVLLLAVFGVMGGYLSNTALMLGQKKLRKKHQEGAGLIMQSLLVAGLGVGAGCGHLLVSLL